VSGPTERAAPPVRRGCLDWKSAVGLLVSATLLYWVFRGQDPALILHNIATARPFPFVVATFWATFVFVIRAWRWRVILEPTGIETSFRSRFAATAIGFMGNNLIPLRVGEFMRAFALARVEPVPVVAAFSSLVIERLLDGAAVVGLLFVSMTLPGFPGLFAEGAVYTTVARGIAVTVAAVFAVLFAFVLWPRPAVRLAEAAVRVLPHSMRRPIVDALEAFLAGAAILRNPLVLLRSVVWTLVHWMVNALGFWFAFRAFGLDLDYTAALFFQSVIAIAVSVPSAPGFFGPFEAAATLVLAGMWGASTDRATALAIGFHVASFIPVTLIGLWYARAIGFSLRDAGRSEERVEEAVEEATGPEGG
jgi:uncharacterized protein (TIRG00374 family)